jgi:glycosyltransferase involved in cell wall biosynthesis
MKIMVVTPYFFPKVGGLENYALKLSKALQEKHQNEVFIVTTSDTKHYFEENVEGLRVIRLPIMLKVANTPLSIHWYRQLKKIIKEEKPDVINAHSPVPGISDIAIWAAGQTPTVLTYHAATLRKNGSFIFNLIAAFYERLQTITFSRSSEVIAVSDYVKNSLPIKFQHKTKVVYNAMDLTDIPSSVIKRLNERVVFIASLDKTHRWKGLSDIFHAIEILVKSVPNIELIVIGDGNNRAKYELLSERLGIKNNVKFLGTVTGSKKYSLIQSSIATIIYPTTSNDAFPTVLLEAWACNSIVIASKTGALPHLIKDSETGYLVKRHDPPSLARKIYEVVTNSESSDNISLNGKMLIHEEYNWMRASDKTNAIFSKLIKINNKSQKIRILRIVSSGYEQGGVENGISISNELLKKQGYDIRVLSSNSRPDMKHFSDFEFSKLPDNVMKKMLFGIFNPSSYIKTRKILRDFKPDIVMLHTMQEPTASILFLLRHYPVIVCVHGPEVYTKPLIPWLLPITDFKNGEIKKEKLNFIGKIHYIYFKNVCGLVYKMGLRNVDEYIAFSHYTQEMLSESGITNSKYIPNGVKLFKKSPRNSIDELIISYAGRLEKFKGVEYLISAMPDILNFRPDASLTIAGEGSYKNELMELVKSLALQNKVSFVGHLNQADMYKFYKNSSIFVLPSTWPETFGKAGVEAMSVGRPVIATNVGGVSDWLINNLNGALVEPGDSQQISDAVVKILKNDQIYKNYCNAARTSAKNFSVEKLVYNYGKLFNEIVESH